MIMENEIATLKQQIEEQRKVVDAIYQSIEKMRKYFLITAWVTVLAIVLPLIGILFVGPSFVGNYTSTLENPGK